MWLGTSYLLNTPSQASKDARSHELLAELNAPIEAIPADERAWPAYRGIALRIEPLPELLWETWPTSPGDHAWNEAVAYLNRNEWAIEALHEAADRPFLGYAYSFEWDHDFLRARAEASGHVYKPSKREDPPSLLLLRSTARAQYLRFSRLLSTSCAFAQWSGDSDRLARDIETMIAMSRHLSQGATGADKVASSTLLSIAADTLMRGLESEPGLLRDDHLLQLDRLLIREDPRGMAAGVHRYMRLVFADNRSRFGSMFVTRADRRRMARDAETFITESERGFVGEPWVESTWDRPTLDRYFNRLETASRAVKLPASVFTLGVDDSVRSARAAVFAETHRDAARVMIHAELHRRAHGSYPSARDIFGEDVRSWWPADPMDGEPLRYALLDGSPILYSVGDDRNDDGGTLRKWWGPPGYLVRSQWESYRLNRPDMADRFIGDWILFPPEEPREWPPD